MKILGAVDVVDRRSATGWVYSDIVATIEVQATLDNQIIGEAAAVILRPDLAEAGVGDGKCGFVVEFYSEIDPTYIPFVVVKIAGGDAELPRYSASGFQNYFNALFVRYPATGRSRCVFGGLWTDRTDAKALLRGKAAIGEIATGEIAPLERIIGDGYLMLDGIRNPDATDLGQCAANLVSEPAILALLRRMFEDQPVVLSVKINDGSEQSFAQSSNLESTPSPAECLSIVVPLDKNGVSMDIVRQSHELPEFSASGQSRWTTSGMAAGIEVALSRQGLIDRDILKKGKVAVVGPGLIHRIQAEPASRWLRIVCAPARHAPLQFALSSVMNEPLHASGVRVFS